MGVQVTFDYQAWVAAFPALASTPEPTIVGPVLTIAQQFFRNDGGGPVNNAATQTTLLNLMVSHITVLYFGTGGQAASPLVGRVSSAGEGSVNVSVEMNGPPGAAWYNQTQYGAAFWAASMTFRSATYVPGHRRW